MTAVGNLGHVCDRNSRESREESSFRRGEIPKDELCEIVSSITEREKLLRPLSLQPEFHARVAALGLGLSMRNLSHSASQLRSNVSRAPV